MLLKVKLVRWKRYMLLVSGTLRFKSTIFVCKSTLFQWFSTLLTFLFALTHHILYAYDFLSLLYWILTILTCQRWFLLLGTGGKSISNFSMDK